MQRTKLTHAAGALLAMVTTIIQDTGYRLTREGAADHWRSMQSLPVDLESIPAGATRRTLR